MNRSLNIMVGFLGDPDMLPRAGDVTSERLKAARMWQGARWEVRSLMSWEPLWSWSLRVLDEGHCGLDIFQTAGEPNLSTYYEQNVLLPCSWGLFFKNTQNLILNFLNRAHWSWERGPSWELMRITNKQVTRWVVGSSLVLWLVRSDNDCCHRGTYVTLCV